MCHPCSWRHLPTTERKQTGQDKQNARCLDNIDKNLLYDLLLTLLFPLNISLWMVRYISNLRNIFWNQFWERHVVFTTKKEIIGFMKEWHGRCIYYSKEEAYTKYQNKMQVVIAPLGMSYVSSYSTFKMHPHLTPIHIPHTPTCT